MRQGERLRSAAERLVRVRLSVRGKRACLLDYVRLLLQGRCDFLLDCVRVLLQGRCAFPLDCVRLPACISNH